jgi:hypothetical protein
MGREESAVLLPSLYSGQGVNKRSGERRLDRLNFNLSSFLFPLLFPLQFRSICCFSVSLASRVLSTMIGGRA